MLIRLLAGSLASLSPAPVVGLIQAAAETASGDPLTYLSGLGSLGAVAVLGLLFTGQVRTKSEVEGLLADKKRLNSLLDRKDSIIEAQARQIVRLSENAAGSVAPALSRAVEATASVPDTLADLREGFQRLGDALDRLDRDRR